jgi:hypothetical protein
VKPVKISIRREVMAFKYLGTRVGSRKAFKNWSIRKEAGIGGQQARDWPTQSKIGSQAEKDMHSLHLHTIIRQYLPSLAEVYNSEIAIRRS